MNVSLVLIALAVTGVIVLVVLAVVLNIQNRQAGLDQSEPGIQTTRPPLDLGSTELPPGSGGLELQIQELLRQGRKVEAIKVYRDATGARLKEAKEVVESMEQGNPLGSIVSEVESHPSTVVELLRAGNKIEAIRIYKQNVGCSLKEAKEAVEALERSL